MFPQGSTDTRAFPKRWRVLRRARLGELIRATGVVHEILLSICPFLPPVIPWRIRSPILGIVDDIYQLAPIAYIP